jgi:hypothetical protein
MEPQPRLPNPGLVQNSRDYRRSALAFFAFAGLIAVDIVLVAAFNPDRGQLDFWIKLIIIFGSLLVWRFGSLAGFTVAEASPPRTGS